MSNTLVDVGWSRTKDSLMRADLAVQPLLADVHEALGCELHDLAWRQIHYRAADGLVHVTVRMRVTDEQRDRLFETKSFKPALPEFKFMATDIRETT